MILYFYFLFCFRIFKCRMYELIFRIQVCMLIFQIKKKHFEKRDKKSKSQKWI